MRYQMRRRGPWWLTEDAWKDLEENMQRRGAWPRGWSQQSEERTWAPVADMYDKGDKILVKVELPGVPEEAIEVSLEQGILTIRGERETEEEVADESWFCCERPRGKFYRAIQVPAEVDVASVGADYRDGVLTITLPKQEEEKTRKIAVTSG